MLFDHEKDCIKKIFNEQVSCLTSKLKTALRKFIWFSLVLTVFEYYSVPGEVRLCQEGEACLLNLSKLFFISVT